MNFNEYTKVKNYSYEQYVAYLIEKYGKIEGSYFTNNFSPVTSIKRRDEELFIHHIKEDTIANLSNVEVARISPFEYQLADNLVYANLLEHILLHIMIGEQNKGLGFGGAEIMILQANDFYDSFDNERESVLADGFEVLEELKERMRNSISAYETLFQHNQTVFLELEDTLEKNDRVLVVIGTGLGKTTTALAYLRKYGMRGLVLGPNRIITDAWEKNKEVDVYTYQWFMNNYKTIDFSQYGVLICDEAHHCAAPKWGEGVRYVLDNSLIKVMGLTATPKEQRDKKNYETSSQFFKGCVCQGFTVLDGIERGIIHDFSYVGAIYDTSGIREKYSDLSDEKLKGELDLALNNTPTMEEIFRKHLPLSKRKGIVFCTDIKAIDEAEVIMRKVLPDAEFRRMHSLMGAEAEEARRWFEGTDEGWLFAVNMISEGAHYKGVNTIVMFRRTESSLVFNQQLGRIITLARDEDPEAIVFDLVNNANNITKGKSFAGSLKRAYQQRKERGDKQKSEQIIVEDYAETISDVLKKIRDDFIPGHPLYCIDANYNIVKEYSRVGKTAQDGFKPKDVSQALMGKINNVGGYYWCFVKDYLDGWRPKVEQRKRAIIIIETGEIIESIAAFQQKYGGDLSSHLAGRQKTVSGFHCAYADDHERIESLQEFVGLPRSVYKREKAVINLDTKEIFASVAEASRHYPQTNRTGIGNVCQGKQFTCGGYHWSYYSTELDIENALQKILLCEKEQKNQFLVKIICLETEKIFNGIKEAAMATSADQSGISACLAKKQQTAGGYHWMYYTDYCEQNRTALDIITEIEATRNGKCTKRQRVVCIETGDVFDSLASAAAWCGTANGSVKRACENVAFTCGGYHWALEENCTNLQKNKRTNKDFKKSGSLR